MKAWIPVARERLMAAARSPPGGARTSAPIRSRRYLRRLVRCAARRPSRFGAKGFAALLIWARDLGEERVWALEDCRHVSGAFERFLSADFDTAACDLALRLPACGSG